jgi:dipeptidyl aminopeptidase/acylaminoacyl peptidase
VLLTREVVRTELKCQPPGGQKERDLSWFDGPFVRDISADGSMLLFDEEAEGGGADGTIYLRKTDGSPAVKIGEGIALALSPDGRFAVARRRDTTPPRLVLLPTGVGEPREIDAGKIEFREMASWFPDGMHLLLSGKEPDHQGRSYVYDTETGEARAATPEGVVARLVSPDGKSVIAAGRQMKRSIVSLDGGDPKPIPGLGDDDVLLRWSADGRSLYVAQGRSPVTLARLDIATGRREPLRELAPADPAGGLGIFTISITPDGRAYAYTYLRTLSDLYVVDGLN